MNNKETLEALIKATNCINNVIFYLERANMKLEVANMYDTLARVSGIISVLSENEKNAMLKSVLTIK